MTITDVALAVLATMALAVLLTRIAVYWLRMPCKCEHDEHEDGGP